MEIILHPHQFTEDNVKKAHLPHATSLAVALSLALGIFVAGLTNSRVVPSAKAQSLELTVATPEATLVGTSIAARGVVINGVATDAIIPGSVRITDASVSTTCGLTAVGFSSTGDTVYALGVFASGNDSDAVVGPNGVFASGNYTDTITDEDAADAAGGPNGVFASGEIYVGTQLQVVGGSLSGSNIQVTDGVVTGSDLQVVGAHVSGACGD